ncbi:hypothetical protein J6590_007278 [Homalodisca vitripennis]|nr:hypothetical protein J6590_007278 [Homalodisca vitripennis]
MTSPITLCQLHRYSTGRGAEPHRTASRRAVSPGLNIEYVFTHVSDNGFNKRTVGLTANAYSERAVLAPRLDRQMGCLAACCIPSASDDSDDADMYSFHMSPLIRSPDNSGTPEVDAPVSYTITRESTHRPLEKRKMRPSVEISFKCTAHALQNGG